MYQLPHKEAWQGRTDVTDGEKGYRWHQVIRFLDLSKPVETEDLPGKKICFLGFCCDEGVKRNQGRPGAAKGPEAVRKALSGLAVHFMNDEIVIYDAGDVICAQGNMEAAQVQLASKIKILLESDFLPIVLGGGHEVAFAHYMGIKGFLNEKVNKLGIINFDAHFDLRKVVKEATSGTPFWQILENTTDFKGQFPYLCMGIQESSNTKVLFETAHANLVAFIKAEKMNFRHLEEIKSKVYSFIKSRDALYVSVDLDVFAAAYAPGVSATNANGVLPEIVVHLLEEIFSSRKVISVDFAELNPDLDIDSRTAKLTAALIYEVVKALKLLSK